MGLSWDDYRLAKAIADHGGLTRAAVALGVNHSTAFRRLAAIEAALGTRLFERTRLGYAPTEAGDAMLAAAARMEADATQFERVAAGQAAMPSGELRLTAPAGFVTDLLMPLLAAFRTRHPAITLDLVVSEEPLNLSRRDADVAIRASNDPPANLVGRRVSGIAWAVYGRGDARYGDLNTCRWIGLAPGVGGGVFRRFLDAQVAPERIVLRVSAVVGLCEAVEAGLGIGVLPCHVADARPGLVRLRAPEPTLASGLWLLTHPDLRHAGRVRAFMDFMAEAVGPLRAALEGRREPIARSP